MPQMVQNALFLFLLLTSQISLLPAALPDPDPAAIQPGSTLFPSSSSSFSPPSTIPAFPEQSDVSSSSCPLSLPEDIPNTISTSCSSARRLSHCCPSLAAFLYSAYSATALSLPAAQTYDQPVLPDDSESCAGQVEKALRARGVELPRVNATCDVAYCYCGVRLRRLSCAGGFVADEAEGKWVAREEEGRRMERECTLPGLAGCNRCLWALNQLEGGNVTGSVSKDGRECQLMGVTWLLSKNRTLYLPTATSVLRAIMAVPNAGDGEVGPTSCSIPGDEMPFAVDSDEINDDEGSFAVKSSTALLSPFVLLLLHHLVVSFIF